MIEITPNIKSLYPQAFALARKDRMRVVWLEGDLVYCARRQKGHGQYLIRFFVTPRVNGDPQVKMRCNSITGPPCKWTEFNEGMCSHMAKVLLRGLAKKGKREQREAA